MLLQEEYEDHKSKKLKAIPTFDMEDDKNEYSLKHLNQNINNSNKRK